MAKNEGVREEEEKRKTIAMVGKHQRERHKFNMEELKFARESERIRHEHELERQRIKTAEIRKAQERKDWYNNQSRTHN